MIIDNIYMNLVHKSFKTHEKYVKSKKYKTYGYVKELIGHNCLVDLAFDGTKIQVLTDIFDISLVDMKRIPSPILDILNKESEWEWMDNYFADIID